MSYGVCTPVTPPATGGKGGGCAAGAARSDDAAWAILVLAFVATGFARRRRARTGA